MNTEKAHQGATSTYLQPNDSILKLPEVMSLTRLARSTIYHHIKDGLFPKPIKLGPRSSGWIEREVYAWLEQRIEESRGAAS